MGRPRLNNYLFNYFKRDGTGQHSLNNYLFNFPFFTAGGVQGYKDLSSGGVGGGPRSLAHVCVKAPPPQMGCHKARTHKRSTTKHVPQSTLPRTLDPCTKYCNPCILVSRIQGFQGSRIQGAWIQGTRIPCTSDLVLNSLYLV